MRVARRTTPSSPGDGTDLQSRADNRLNTSISPPDFDLEYPHLSLMESKCPVEFSDWFVFSAGSEQQRVCIASSFASMQKPWTRPLFCSAGPRIRSEFVATSRYLRVMIFPKQKPGKVGLPTCCVWRIGGIRFSSLCARSEWKRFWDISDIDLLSLPEEMDALRFNLYHLRIAANHDSRVSVGARGLSGRAYQGHVFWDA